VNSRATRVDSGVCIGHLWPAMLSLLLLLTGCSDNGLGVATADNNTAPDIEVSPGTVDFGPIPLDGVGESLVEVRNLGDAALTLDRVELSGDAAFALGEGVDGLWIEAGGVATVALEYRPVNESDAGFATFYSNDPDEPSLPVSLLGRGAFPQLSIVPTPVELGQVELCDSSERAVRFENSGEDDLELRQILLAGEGMTLLDAPVLPLTLAPGESADATVHFAPGRAAGIAGELWADSNDPAGARQAVVSATGVVDGQVEVEEHFRQPDGPWESADIMFFVDRSCSMKDDQANLVRNIDLLAQELDDAASDWQMMVTIDDNGCHEGALLTPETADVEGGFEAALATAPGEFTEAGLTIVTNGIERSLGGGCNDGFLRSDSKTLLVTVSDEPEQSPDPWKDYVARIQALAPTAAVVAVVGDADTGCPTALPGTGYIEAADFTGGTFLSICSPDWGRYFDVVGELASEGPKDRFDLRWPAEPDTIEVEVDGVASTAWTYDDVVPAIVFDIRPQPLAAIDVRYAPARSCDEAGDTGASDTGAGASQRR